MGTININGMTFRGNNIVVNNNEVFIDGKRTDLAEVESKTINIDINGDVQMLDVDSCNNLYVKGDTDSIKTVSGEVVVEGNVNGSVTTVSGDVECTYVEGSVSTVSGNVSKRL